MPGINTRRKYWTSTSDDLSYADIADIEPKHYCLKCESFGFRWQELGPRVYKDEELINGQEPHDADLWMQCYRCGTITPASHGRQEGRIKGFIDVPDTIHDTARLKIEPFITPRKKNIRNKKINDLDPALPSIEQDKDIQIMTKQSGRELSNYSDSSTA